MSDIWKKYIACSFGQSDWSVRDLNYSDALKDKLP